MSPSSLWSGLPVVDGVTVALPLHHALLLPVVDVPLVLSNMGQVRRV
jgi:hypothetical protein